MKKIKKNKLYLEIRIEMLKENSKKTILELIIL